MDIKFDQRQFDIPLVVDGEGFYDLDIILSPEEELMQRLFLRFKTFKKDLFWNVGYGIDYLNDVFGKNKPILSVDIIIKNEIMKEPMVQEISYFESEIFNYTYACKFGIKIRRTKKIATYYILTNENGVILTNEKGDTLTNRI